MLPAARMPPLGIAGAAALLAGVCACLWLPWLSPWWGSLLLLAAAGVLLRQGLLGSRARAVLAGWFVAGFAIAGLHAAHALRLQLPATPERVDAVLVGRIVDLPVHEPRRTRFAFRVEQSDVDAVRGRELRLSWYDDDPIARGRLGAGQRWRFNARLRAPRSLRNPGGVDGEKHAMAQRVAATGYLRDPASARLLAPARGIDAWREAMSGRIAHDVAHPSSRFVRAIALGDVRGLDDADWRVLRANGLTHLIAISGFHVGLVAGFFALWMRGLWWLWPAWSRRVPAPVAAAGAAMMGGWLYTAVAGFALPTTRTALMISIVALMRMRRLPLRAMDALALATFAVLLVDPLAVLAAGFWLSFAGVAWLLGACRARAGGRCAISFRPRASPRWACCH